MLPVQISSEELKQLRNAARRFNADFKANMEVFYDLCFCICAPQTTFTANRQVNDTLRASGFFSVDIDKARLEEIARPARFFRQKAENLSRAKTQFPDIIKVVRSQHLSEYDKRDWIVGNVRGMGMKAASHFLRNMGCQDLAIIDTHILKFLEHDAPSSIEGYLELEEIFREAAHSSDLTIAELDMWVWKVYSNTEWKDFVA